MKTDLLIAQESASGKAPVITNGKIFASMKTFSCFISRTREHDALSRKDRSPCRRPRTLWDNVSKLND